MDNKWNFDLNKRKKNKLLNLQRIPRSIVDIKPTGTI